MSNNGRTSTPGQTIITPSDNNPNLLMNFKAELAVLACLIQEPYSFADVSHFLQARHFKSRATRGAYSTYLEMTTEGDGNPPDYLAWEQRLIDKQVMTADDNLLLKAVNTVPVSVAVTGQAIKRHAEDVIAMYKRRKYAEAAKEIEQASHDMTLDPSEVGLKSQAAVMDAITQTDDFSSVVDMKTAVSLLDERLDKQARGEIKSFNTGYIDLDKLFGGIEVESMVTIAARPGMGKTSLLLGIALNMAKQGNRVFLFSLEMPVTQLVIRMIANLSGIDATLIRAGQIDDGIKDRFNEAKAMLRDLPILIDDTPSIGPAYVTSRLRRQQMSSPIDVFAVDYLQFMESEKQHFGVEDETNYISRQLKATTRNIHGISFIASQLNRSVESRKEKRPQLSDLRNSGAIEQDSDAVLFIYRDEYYLGDQTTRPNIAELIVAKHRHGPTGTVDLYWNGKLNRFANLERQQIIL